MTAFSWSDHCQSARRLGMTACNRCRQSVTGRRLDVRKPLSRVAGILGLAMLCGLLRAAAGAPDAIAAPGIEVRACAAAAGIVCAVLADSAGARREVKFAVAPFTPVDAGAMGAFDIGGSRHLLAYVYGAGKGGDARVLVIDETAGRKLAEAAASAGYGVGTVWFAYIRDPAGRRRPFIAPGAHYLTPHRNPTGAYQASEWNYLCLFNPAALARPDATCGTGFTAYSTHFATPQGPDAAISGFRHGGGWVEDVDGDGWDDINLPFLQYILTLSGRTGRPLALAHFDVAAQSEPRSPPYFHSGRFYGRFAAFTEPATGRHDVLFTDGEAAGYFGGLIAASAATSRSPSGGPGRGWCSNGPITCRSPRRSSSRPTRPPPMWRGAAMT
jgi:hypothetical protein